MNPVSGDYTAKRGYKSHVFQRESKEQGVMVEKYMENKIKSKLKIKLFVWLDLMTNFDMEHITELVQARAAHMHIILRLQ